MRDKEITKKQHYVPRVYLKGFSSDKIRVWSYSLCPIDDGKLVPIESVCRENYLYEPRDKNGELSSPNRIEKVLSGLEGKYAANLRRLENMAVHKENYKIACFLSSEEIAFWKLFVVVQMMRMPSTLESAYEVSERYLMGEQLSKNEAHAAALAYCLPFFSELKSDDKNVLTAFLRPMLNMSIVIGVDEQESIFASDNPVYCYSPESERIDSIQEYGRIVMPLTSKLVLVMFGGEEKRLFGRNRLIPLATEDLDAIKRSVAYSARDRVFSKEKIVERDLELVQSARMDRESDRLSQNDGEHIEEKQQVKQT